MALLVAPLATFTSCVVPAGGGYSVSGTYASGEVDEGPDDDEESVTVIPAGYTTTYVDGVPYYVSGGYYYRRGPHGYYRYRHAGRPVHAHHDHHGTHHTDHHADHHTDHHTDHHKDSRTSHNNGPSHTSHNNGPSHTNTSKKGGAPSHGSAPAKKPSGKPSGKKDDKKHP